MFEINDRIEDLAIESKQLSSLGLVISEAIRELHSNADSFVDGIDLFSSLLYEHNQKMNALLEQAQNYEEN